MVYFLFSPCSKHCAKCLRPRAHARTHNTRAVFRPRLLFVGWSSYLPGCCCSLFVALSRRCRVGVNLGCVLSALMRKCPGCTFVVCGSVCIAARLPFQDPSPVPPLLLSCVSPTPSHSPPPLVFPDALCLPRVTLPARRRPQQPPT